MIPLAKAIFERGPEPGKTIVSRNVKQLKSTGVSVPQGLRSIQFQVNPKTGKEDIIHGLKYPRGYTPEAMQDVRGLEDSGQLTIYGGGVSSTVRGMGPRRELEAKTRENIARSALTPRQFTGDPLRIKIVGALDKRTTDDSAGDRTIGVYRLSDKTAEIKQNYVDTDVLMHELAHHYDPANPSLENIEKQKKERWAPKPPEPLSFSSPTLDNSLKNYWRSAGTQEAFADTEAARTFRPDPRRKARRSPVSSIYPLVAAIGLHLPEYYEAHLWAKGYVEGSGVPLAPEHPGWHDKSQEVGGFANFSKLHPVLSNVHPTDLEEAIRRATQSPEGGN